MSHSWAAPCVRLTLARRVTLVMLAAAFLLTGFVGRAGVQVVDGAMAARLFALHLHGVPGEAEFVQSFGMPAPFVHPHCHDAVQQQTPPPSPDEVQAASTLAGSFDCTMTLLFLPPLPALVALAIDATVTPDGLILAPSSPPPQG